MKRFDLIRRVSLEAGVSQEKCERFLDALIKVMTDCLANGDKIRFKNFMSFEIAEMPERICKHPQTGDEITFPPVKFVKMKISKTLRKAINQK